MDSTQEFLVTSIKYSNKQPELLLLHGENFTTLKLSTFSGTIYYDNQKTFCAGSINLETSERSPCPELLELDGQKTECFKCMTKTGFNPAFYHAKTISPQQEKRNSEPHFLYLAYFSPNCLKVGISYKNRGITRLLEQGARCALILNIFHTANQARKYEEEISTELKLKEVVNQKTKISLISQNYDEKKARKTLENLKLQIEQKLGINFKQTRFVNCNDFYFFDENYLPERITKDATEANKDEDKISGKIIASIGQIAIFDNKNDFLIFYIKNLVGRKIKIDRKIISIKSKIQQSSLFM